MTGNTIAHYEILEKLGEGGMGIVYKARDTRLNRFVALKLLPAAKLADEERLRRFTQEARAASALNHPNIITIHDIASENGTPFIVMEYVAGKQLDQLIPKKGMRTTEVLKLGVQIADGLAAAAAAGVIHRDVKPGNIMVSDSGHVKVLDFGLAKAPETPAPQDGATATLATREGTVMGTAAYMSPEQAEGKPVDARSDIFSFGAVLYEMITGQRAFRGDTSMSTISAILRDDPAPVTQLTSDVPRDLEKIVIRCLRKDPERRFQSMADIRVALRELQEESDSGRIATPVAGVAPPARRSRLWIAAVAGLVVFAGMAFVAMRPKQAAPVDAEMRVVPFSSYPGSQRWPAFSPDGNQLAFSWTGEHGDVMHIYVKVIGTETPLQLTSAANSDVTPVWAPDGRAIYFLRSIQPGVSIFQVSPLGGKERLVASFAGAGTLRITPDGKWLLLSGQESPEEKSSSVYVVSTNSDVRRKLSLAVDRPVAAPALAPDGKHLAVALFLPDNGSEVGVFAIDPKLEVSGAPVILKLPRGQSIPWGWTADSREVLVRHTTSIEISGRMMRVPADGTGTARNVSLGTEGVSFATISDSGNRVAFSRRFGDVNIWSVPLIGPGKAGTPEPAVQSTRGEWVRPNAFSPDGQRVVFESNRSGVTTVWMANVDGSQASPLVAGGANTTGSPAWSPDGKWIAFDTRTDGNAEIYVVSADGGTARRLTNHPSTDAVPSWSRDGRSIYFMSDRTGRFEVFKVPAAGGEAVQVTQNGGWGASESADGKWLYYLRDRGPSGPPIAFAAKFPLLRMPLEGGPETKVLDGLVQRCWAVTPEGVWYLWAENNQSAELRFFDFKTGKSATAARMNKSLQNGIALSPDGRRLLYNQTDAENSEILIIENFR